MNEHEIYMWLKWLQDTKGIVLGQEYSDGMSNYTASINFTEDDVVEWLKESSGA